MSSIWRSRFAIHSATWPMGGTSCQGWRAARGGSQANDTPNRVFFWVHNRYVTCALRCTIMILNDSNVPSYLQTRICQLKSWLSTPIPGRQALRTIISCTSLLFPSSSYPSIPYALHRCPVLLRSTIYQWSQYARVPCTSRRFIHFFLRNERTSRN